MTQNILFIVNEQDILFSFKAVFRRQFDNVTANSGRRLYRYRNKAVSSNLQMRDIVPELYCV